MDYNKLHPENSQETGVLKILCFDLSKFSDRARFLWCSFGVFFFYIIYGYLQELIFTLDGFRPYGWYLTLIQFAYYTIFGYLECTLKGISRRIPWSTYIILAFLTLGTMGFSNSSLGYLNYPTQVIFKSCKLIPVLIGGIIIQKKQYGILDFISAGLLCIGLVLFTLADSMISPRFSIIGVIMISSALICDAIIGNLQEKAMKQYKATNTEVVLYSYSIGFLYLFIILLVTGELQKGVAFCSDHILETYGYALLFSVSGYLGIQIVLTLVQNSGAFIAATVTTCRKAITIMISFLFFYKPFTMQYLWSGLLIILGIYLNINSKKRNNKFELKDICSAINQCWTKHNRIQRQMMMNV
ncbi:adenosine 3'-phospho 5'-phosphosulfate transporter 2 [Chelonus insularis]|uniref:adenosine 3'-phospho 5'-phosphosulfate transporter 2 n=1 Tax=Chelonus insularis TaxID=460826 RepID=UPI00158B9D96|nr:adenosine 3'-phospho 5'-phosphosulfate transporter 2 [Chelonus insularis]XP_034939183.1 adenosine 3'-phospho 5'-phosphosulfate transporter 2 [Chelonus insularis]XP_034939185.1 adenosine 3'-phospho 5'-phosphosulfate transporter 2 [Chelonus insularis]XP_034939186.1 adenosine 3'-phospho 5'-phosphosulfate transporter 2 [Chelonus insularis]